MWQSKIAAFTLILILALGIMIPIVPPRALANDNDVTEGLHKLSPEVRSQMNSAKNEKIPIIIMLEQSPAYLDLNFKTKGQERGQIIPALKSRAENSQRDTLAILENQKSRGKVEDIRAFWISNAIAVKALPEVLEQLALRPEVTLIEPDGKVIALEEYLPWGIDRIDAELVWNGTEGGTDVVAGRNAGEGINISILDTGIYETHLDLAKNVKGGHRFLGELDDGNYTDYYGHGTHCAGIIAAVDNEIGVIGTAPEVNLYGVKVLNDTGVGNVSDLIEGIQWSVNNNMHIVSMSLGTENNSTPLHTACNNAYNAGVLLVAAAGNKGNPGGTGDNVCYPAKYDSVIAVAATDSSDTRASFSSTGPAVELAAPGVNIASTWLNNTYYPSKGTSTACPHVTGTAALVWRAFPEYNNIQIRQRLQETAEDLGAPDRDDWYGYGLVDAENATRDNVPPASVTNLNTTAAGPTWIYWTWTNPPNTDFNFTMVYLNGTWQRNTSNPFYNATGLEPDTWYEIATRTVDNLSNINESWVRDTAATLDTVPTGDFDGDGDVDLTDFVDFAGAYATSTGNPLYNATADFDKDGDVDFDDFVEFAGVYTG